MPTKSKLVYLPLAQHDFEEIVKYHIMEALGFQLRDYYEEVE